MKIIVDTREKPRAIAQILAYFEQNGIEYEKRKLNTGDYMREDNPLLTVDRKQNLGEVANNLTNDNGRFMREVRRASESGQKLIVLVRTRWQDKDAHRRSQLAESNPRKAPRSDRRQSTFRAYAQSVGNVRCRMVVLR